MTTILCERPHNCDWSTRDCLVNSRKTRRNGAMSLETRAIYIFETDTIEMGPKAVGMSIPPLVTSDTFEIAAQ